MQNISLTPLEKAVLQAKRASGTCYVIQTGFNAFSVSDSLNKGVHVATYVDGKLTSAKWNLSQMVREY